MEEITPNLTTSPVPQVPPESSSPKQRIGYIVLVAIAIAVLLLVFSFFGDRGRQTEEQRIAKEKKEILSRTAAAERRPLSEDEKRRMTEVIRGRQIDKYNFTMNEVNDIMRALNK